MVGQRLGLQTLGPRLWLTERSCFPSQTLELHELHPQLSPYHARRLTSGVSQLTGPTAKICEYRVRCRN
jgi:hypothetical protein